MSAEPTGRSQDGVPRTVVVTGASAGLGYFAAEQLAAAGHRVVLATRNPVKARAAETSIRAHVADARVEHLHLDLADLDSVAAAVTALADVGPVDAVVNNAGVVGSGAFRRTAQGIELQFGTNHIGHFAWTAGVLPLLERTGGRVVHLGSISHRWAWLDRDHPDRSRPYVNYLQYARSKLAVMLFGFELAERLADAGSSVASIVAHPGLALDTLAPARPGVLPTTPTPAWVRAGERFWSQGKDVGAEPLVHAAVGEGVRSGEYWGPSGWMQLRGAPAVVPAEPRAHDRTAAAHLWAASERLSGVALRFDTHA
ncbi:SDR family NAD(P)-dependent oxidoreductase [Curtobacterium sp. RRHDQ10]|uniref:SDR family NAD(P)-dependent oxidoreductase n=1 Tax=Curtobacterium phyllosphaerae TaxID=3413379 RepID=UPI003BEFDE7B